MFKSYKGFDTNVFKRGMVARIFDKYKQQGYDDDEFNLNGYFLINECEENYLTLIDCLGRKHRLHINNFIPQLDEYAPYSRMGIVIPQLENN